LLRPFAAAKTQRAIFLAFVVSLLVLRAFAWVFPEHRDIVVLAIQKLDVAQRAQLQQMWSEARAGHETRLCESAADSAQDAKPTCVDYAAWAAIAGDHSCSARDMLNTVLNAPWVPGVLKVSSHLKSNLAAAERRDERINAVRDSDLALERTDPEYATRATSNNAHFLLARPDAAMEPEAYARLALGPQAGLNALGTYVWYHLRALQEAMRIARGGGSGDDRPNALRAALADEAFALHFLEDSFAAGHVAGNWGDTAVRKGTHDYYSEHGISLVTWDHHAFVALGDAYMRPEDAERAATAVRDSLVQLLDALAGKLEVSETDQDGAAGPNGFDVCHATRFAATSGTREDIKKAAPVFVQTPMPALGAGIGELPRFRSELGPFIGFSSALHGGVQTRGFGASQTDVNSIFGIEAAARAGLGLEGVLNESSDGLVFLEFGLRADRHAGGTLTIPGRSAITARFRAPFWLIPGDLLIAGPILAFTSPVALQKMAIQAANGGLIPWQSGIATRFGRLQFVLGREVGAGFYRNGSDHPLIFSTPSVPPLGLTVTTLKSLQLDFPIFEYRLFRTFSVNQSSSLMIQPFVGFDTPINSSVVAPVGAPKPPLHTVPLAGARIVFDWRHYFSIM
jgi:hypothetical protein